MIAALLERFGSWLVAGTGLIVSLFLLVKNSRDKAVLEERLENQKQQSEERIQQVEEKADKIIEVVENAKSVSDSVSSASDADVDKRLSDKWDG